MSEWRDYQLPADETLRVLAGNPPTRKFRARYAALCFVGWLIGAAIAITIWCIFVGYGLTSGLLVLALCAISTAIGFALGIKAVG